MESRAKLLGYPIHQMLIVFPVGLLGGGLVDRLVVGVDDGAHVDAPSSLTTRHGRG
jgi:hypothetical protein